MNDRVHKVRVMKTHEFTDEGLRGLWRYYKEPGEAFDLKKAKDLAREVMSDNPEVTVQISEGIEWLERDKERSGEENE